MIKSITAQRLKILLNTKIFIEDIKELRSMFNIPLDGYSEQDTLKQFSMVHRMPKEFSEHIKGLRNSYKLPYYWHKFLVYFTLFNIQIEIDDRPVVQLSRSAGEQDLSMNIRIWDHTTLEDISSIWNFVLEMKPNYFALSKDRYKLRDPELLDRDIEILNCHFSGMSNREIALHLANFTKKQNDTKLSDKYTVSEDQISKILESLKDTAGITES